MKRLFMLVLLMFIMISVIPSGGYAADSVAEKRYEKGKESFLSGDYDIAFSYFVISGEEKGYAPAQNMLGICYRDGLGTVQDMDQAEHWFSAAADQGYFEAELNLKLLNQKREKAGQNALESTPTPIPSPAWTSVPTPIRQTPIPYSSTPTPAPVNIPISPSSLYGSSLKENLINGVYYTDIQKVRVVTETYQYRKDKEGKYRPWYYGTYRDDIYPGYRVELYFADGMLFFAVVTQNSRNQVTLYYWGDQIVACQDLRGSNKDLSYTGSTVYTAVNAEFGNLYSIAQQFAPSR